MRVFSTYLAREWREHRSALALCAAISAGLSLWMVTYLDEYTVRLEGIPLIAIAQAMALFLFVIGGSLFSAGERNAPRFMERMPRGLHTAYFAKASFYVLGLLACSAVSVAALYLFSMLWIGFAPGVDRSLGLSWTFVLIALPVLGWTLAASTWVPRPGLALPIGLFSLAILAWPYFVMSSAFGDHFVVEFDQSVVFACVMALAALPATLVGFRLARSTQRRESLAGLSTLLVGGLFALPSWAWIPLSRPGSLTTLEWSEDLERFGVSAGPDGDLYVGWAGMSLPWQSTTADVVYRLNEDRGVLELMGQAEVTQVSQIAPLPEMRSSKLGSRGFCYHRFVCGKTEWHYVDRDLRYDFTLEQLFGEPVEIADDPSVWIGEDGWILQASPEAPLQSFDPKSGLRRALDWPHSTWHRGLFGLMLHDGRFLWSSEGRLFAGDPNKGTMERIELPLDTWSFQFASPYLNLGARFGDTRPVVLQVESDLYFLEEDRLVAGPCLFEADNAFLIGYRERSGRREFLWQSMKDCTIWMSDVDSGKAQRLFPRERPHGS